MSTLKGNSNFIRQFYEKCCLKYHSKHHLNFFNFTDSIYFFSRHFAPARFILFFIKINW